MQIRSFNHFNHCYELRSSWCIGINWDRHDEDVNVPLEQKFASERLLGSLIYLYD